MKVTVKAPSNIAFIKYWGKKNEKLRIPANPSISMNLSGAYTVTSVEFDKKLNKDNVFINKKQENGIEAVRVTKHLDLIRQKAGLKIFARVESINNFPKGAGIASSASGFAALTVAASRAAGLRLGARELSILARIGSGSACRSIPDGFVEWRTGNSSKDSYATSLFPAGYWNICDVIAVVGENTKKVSSTEGHTVAASSPFYKVRISGMKNKVSEIKKAMKKKDFTKFGEIIEAEAINMHVVMMTSTPPLYYWMPETLDIMSSVIRWRDEGIESYFTIDAGPNVHVICLKKDVQKIKGRLLRVKGVKKLIVNYPAEGARILS
jgi:diphosphomevalonate decarboxylase